MKKLITTLSVLALATMISNAADKPKDGRPDGQRPNPEEVFKKLDTNNDGAISLEEFKAHRPPHRPGGGKPGGGGRPPKPAK